MSDLSAEALALHADALVIDGHADSFMHLSQTSPRDYLAHGSAHLDLAKQLAAGIDLSIQAAYTPSRLGGLDGFGYTCDLIARVHDAVLRSAGGLRLVRERADLETLGQAPALLLHLEGVLPLGERVMRLEALDQLGVRSIGLTHNPANAAAGGCAAAAEDDRLTDFGREVIRRIEEMGWLLDVAHLGPRSLDQVLEAAEHPVVDSHTGMAALCERRRNLPDSQARAIADGGGLVAIDFVPEHLERELPVDREAVFRHLDHAVTLLGDRHVAIGSDFDGYESPLGGMADGHDYPWLTARMLEAGYPESSIRLILGGNWLRLLEDALARRTP